MQREIIHEYSSTRVFRLWDFHVSHSYLLIRSNGGGQPKENIDLIFGAVNYVEVADILHGIEIRQNTEAPVIETLRERSGRAGPCSGLKAFEIKSKGRLFYVHAGSLLVFINTANPMESPLGIHCAGGDETWQKYVQQYGIGLYSLEAQES
jgi:hypothetical protein